LTLQSTGTYRATEKGYLYYETQGESKILDAGVDISGKNTGNIETVLQQAHLNGTEEVSEDTTLPLFPEKGKEYGLGKVIVCGTYKLLGYCDVPEEEKYDAEHNLVKVQQSATAEGAGENIAKLHSANVFIYQEKGPEEPKFNTTSPILYNGNEYVQNVLYRGEGKSEGWLGEHNGAFEVKTKDPGVGISYFGIVAGGWVKREELLEGGKCEGVQCPPEFNETFTYNKEMGNGEDTAEVITQDAMKIWSAQPQRTIKVDNTPPSNLALTGLPASGVIDEEQYHLKGEATDGKAPTASSGIKSIGLFLDGFEIAGKSGSCTPGPCTAVGEWALNVEGFGTGKHTLTLQATDNAGNVETRTYSITVRHAGSLGVGPGSVDPITGALHLGASDVSLSGGRGTLWVSRSYDSRQLTAGENGPLGPQWSLNVSGSHALEQEPSGSVLLIAPDGSLTTFEGDGKGGFISPKGDENLVLEAEREGETIKAYLLKDPAAGTTVKYTQPGGVGPWVIASSEGALSKTTGGKEMFEWERLEGLTRPKEALAPAPAGVTCSLKLKEPKELSKGCRALTFVYAEKTKEKIGETESEWGEFKGRLKRVIFTAYNPAVGAEKMEEKPVAEYAYDKRGRLRAEWDPRISPALETTYGYDAEGHVTAVTQPGQQPWALTYGTLAGDASTGRLVKVTRAEPRSGASEEEVKAKLKEEQQVQEKNTEAPQLSGSSLVGARMAVSNGKWSISPIVYGYQWEDCNAAGEACTLIPGADNANYTPVEGDIGHKLVALVTAANGGGSVTAASVASGEVRSQITEYPVGEAYFGIASGADGNLWLTQEEADAISKVTPSGGVTTYKLSPTFCGPNYITSGPGSESALWFTDVCNNAIGKITTSGSTTGYKVPSSGATLREITAGPDGNLWFAEEIAGKIGKITTAGTITEYALPKGSDPYGITAGPSKENALWFTDRGTGKIGKITTSGTVSEYSLPSGSEPAGITAGPDGNLWFAEEGTSKIGKITISGTVSEYALYGGSPLNIAAGPDGNLWFGAGMNKLDRITTSGAITEYLLPAGSGAAGITAGPSSSMWFTETGTGRMGKITPGASEAEVQPVQPGTTIDYNVPILGVGAPHEMTKSAYQNECCSCWWQMSAQPMVRNASWMSSRRS
jgi:virginiamycin B lyase